MEAEKEETRESTAEAGTEETKENKTEAGTEETKERKAEAGTEETRENKTEAGTGEAAERKKAEKAARKAEKKAEKKTARAEANAIRSEGEKTRPARTVNEPPKRSVLEEVGNAVTHGVGVLLAVAGLVLLLMKSDTGVKTASSIIYGACMIILFLMSCLYHSFRHGSGVKRLWRRFDYISIYLLIGGTFTPLWLIYWGGRTGTLLCIAQWVIILTGVTLVGVFGPGRPKALHLTLFIVLGWCGLIFLPRMLQQDLKLFWLILCGGIIYTLGIIPFALKKRGAHFLWHFFVLFGALVHWIGIYLYVY